MIAFGDELRADDDIDQPALDIVDEFGGFRGRPQGVRSDDRDARLGKAQRDLVGDPLDARTAGDEAILILALGAEPRRRPRIGNAWRRESESPELYLQGDAGSSKHKTAKKQLRRPRR